MKCFWKISILISLQPLIILMHQLLHGILLWNLTTCLEELFYRTLCNNSCFCHLISFRTTLSMIHVKKSMQIYFSKIICGSHTKIHLYIMDLYLSFAESKVQFATHGKWQLKLWNRLLGNHEDTDADPRTYCAYRKACKIFSALWTPANILIWKYINKQIL